MGVSLAFGKPHAQVGPPSGLGLQPRAATALCRIRGGPGQHRAPARPPILPNASSSFRSIHMLQLLKSKANRKTTVSVAIRGCPFLLWILDCRLQIAD